MIETSLWGVYRDFNTETTIYISSNAVIFVHGTETSVTPWVARACAQH